MGLALLSCDATMADDTLRERIHREYKHQSYLLIEDTDGARLFLFGTGNEPVDLQFVIDRNDSFIDEAFEKTRSTDPRARVRGLTELAGYDDPEALDTALALLADPDTAVRDEAAHLILDHPKGGDVAAALGLIDEDDADE
jgi:hypothetical protein